MSAYTTIDLKRSEAIQLIGLYILKCTNLELGRLVDIVLESQLLNANVHYDGIEVKP